MLNNLDTKRTMKRVYICPQSEIIMMCTETFIAESPVQTGRVASDTPTKGENAIDTEVGYTSSGDFIYDNRHGQGEEGGNRAKSGMIWDEW